VITEGAIDALSYHQLQPDQRTRYISPAGAMSPLQLRLMAKQIAELPPNSTVVAAFDADAAGSTFAETVKGLAGLTRVERHVPPVPKDWNDVLKRHEREYIRSLDQGHKGKGDLGR
jgi:DNA primase